MNKGSAIPNRGRNRSWTLAYIVGDPFFLTTISIALIGWIIAFASSIASNVATSLFPHFAWWAIVYELGCIGGVILVVGYDNIEAYRVALVGFLAAALSFTTSITNSLIYSPRASDEAAASGHLFLSIVNIIWIFYFGTTSDAAAHHWIDSYAITRPSNTQQQHHQQPMSFASNNQLTAQLQPATPTYTQAQPSAGLSSNFPGTTQLSSTSQLSAPGLKRDTYTAESVIEEPTSYPHRAKAIYAYEADMKDPNEISFSKGEVLEVSADITSKWWTVRKADGARGIAPSNYLSLES